MPTPKAPVCQSCAMPMSQPKHFGTEAGGAPSADYCCYCFQKGKFTADLTMSQMIDKLVGFAPQMGMAEPEARAMAEDEIPKLKRWRRA